MSTLPVKTPYHHGDLRDALLTAALDILEQSGDVATLSLRETARRAGVSAMAPYRHFADKDALIAGVATIGFQRFADALRVADTAADGHEALIAQGVAYVAFALENPALFRLMFGAGASSKAHGALAEACRTSFGLLTHGVAGVPSPGDQTDRVLAHWSLVHGFAMLALDGQLERFGVPLGSADAVARAAGHGDPGRRKADGATLAEPRCGSVPETH